MRMRPDRRSLLKGLAAAGAAGLVSAPSHAELSHGPVAGAIEVQAAPIPHFSRVDAARQRFGSLEYRGGLVLKSASRDFGGFSGLVIDPAGRRIASISDVGGWLTGRIDYDDGRPARIGDAYMGPLLALNGRSLAGKREQDAESLTLLDGTLENGTLLVGFERVHRIGRFPIRNNRIGAPAGYLTTPPEARRMNANRGFEALCVLQGGRYKGSIVAISERFIDLKGHHSGWIWINNRPQRFGLTDVDGFDITDAVGLEDGSMVILERRFRWTEGVRMRVRRIRAEEIQPGAVLAGDTLYQADMSCEIDNMEGIAAHKGPRGETVLTLISDDNFNSFLQRTILLQFTMLDEGVASRAR